MLESILTLRKPILEELAKMLKGKDPDFGGNELFSGMCSDHLNEQSELKYIYDCVLSDLARKKESVLKLVES
jgi:hypothetical protein